ncbi:hypothetical protein PVAND_013007 [Polypedilum vanderplanki]|uniref:JmjC domain-containing protein n=1 Tax=Polypedilum vanderplanki TaxID=319348 RepID=A0A9J6CQ60_POLVA|nr:hypothetical protein PVAND_013007 [Polypedilum vanderplanki]
MEELISYITKIFPSEDLIKSCRMQVMTIEDFKVFQNLKDDWHISLKISIEYDILYDKLYIGSYSDVPDDYKKMFLILSFYKAFGILRSNCNKLDDLIEAIRILDVGIMIGCNLENCHLITEFTQKVHDYTIDNYKISYIESNCFDVKPSSDEECEISILENPSIEHFWTNFLHLHRPVKLNNCLNHWPALEKWKDINYFIKTSGYRTVPIELGKTYDDDKWGQSMLKLKDFLRTFVNDEDKKNDTKGYLAQHDLFEQIPALKNDFHIPDYCAISSIEPVVKSWIGPENTISTMHTDDKHNLLCQVIGEKLIILAAPNESQYLYQYDGMLNNTSQVDAEKLDVEKFPLSKNVKFKRVILKAGEMIYIPKAWWHYCRSLTKSISVSFWFDIDNE